MFDSCTGADPEAKAEREWQEYTARCNGAVAWVPCVAATIPAMLYRPISWLAYTLLLPLSVESSVLMLCMRV
eukprot:364397-Chlamydomonas_euryale.AAC.26